MRALIFANGVLRPSNKVKKLIRPDDLLIAADGGALHLRELGLTPRLVVGDFDSLDPETLAELEQAGATLERHSPRKDQTDLELALDLAVSAGAAEIQVWGALGRRWDMTVANIMLPTSSKYDGVKISIIDDDQEFWPVRGGGSSEFFGRPGDVFSLIPLGGEARGVTLEGLEYPLVEATLPLGSTWGVSNVLVGEKGRVSLAAGLLLCILNRKS
ncbi:MAG: thiamine diphosphokinase [Pseudomonadota bacterium]